ncbi:MCE family protein [Myxococcota bacterium]|nr:MCE family protein [Myxococcota bacterium]MBU1428929.1 MCE family protein [Myxococcota bacterium]MBU1900032.1 MCE family protein [Myxococcota bacterium]
MAVTRAQKARLGIFLSAAAALFIGGIIALAGVKLGETRDAYFIRFTQEHVTLSGLDVGSPVKYSGISVGRVANIKVDPKDVSVILVEISLDGGTPIAEDTKANLGSLGITGLKYLELTRGTPGARVRQPGEAIPAGASLMDDLTQQAGQITQQISAVLTDLKVWTGPQTHQRVDGVLQRADKLLQTAEQTLSINQAEIQSVLKRSDQLLASGDALIKEVTVATQQINRMIKRADPRVLAILDQSKGALGRINATLAEVEALAKALQGAGGLSDSLKAANGVLRQVDRLLRQSREDAVEAINGLKETMDNLTVFSEKIKEDPSLLLLREGEDEE